MAKSKRKCCCGEPETKGVKHRKDNPCYVQSGKFMGGITRPKQIRLETEPLCVCCGKMVDKEMAKITKPKPFVYLNELRKIKKLSKDYNGVWVGNDYFSNHVWDAFIKVSAKIAREREKK